ncbi:hypothetical protein D3C73_1215350 [compost metagenome]
MMNAVDNRACCAVRQDNVAVAAHEFDDDFFGRKISKLVALPDVDINDTFHPDLSDGFYDAPFAVLAHQHAEHRSFRRIRRAPVREMNAGIGRIRRQNQLAASARASKCKNKIMIAGLIYFADPLANGGLKLGYDRPGHDAVKCHDCDSPVR